MATVVAVEPIHFVFNMSEADYLKYGRLHLEGMDKSQGHVPSKVQARLMDETGWTHEGVMDFLDNSLDSASGTLRGRAVFANADRQLTPGTFARLRLVGSSPYQATMIPDTAIVSDQ